jgi:TOMM system kinase/cyclase fusion protein
MRREQDLRSESGVPVGYELLGQLGVGGFGDVVRARQIATDREVALKRVRRSDGSTPVDGDQQLQHEIRRCAALVHPNIVPLLDAGTADGATWAAFALIPGESLRTLLDREGPLPVPEALHLLGQVLDALGYAHAQDVVHRDLKPENIMVTTTGLRRNALVLDFGLATTVVDGERGEVVGTAGYAAPEQLRGEAATPRSDLYAWGLVLLECLTGERAVRAGSRHDAVLRQLGPDAVGLPEWLHGQPLGALLRRVTTKAVERRAANAAEVLDELVAITPLAGGDRVPATDRPATAQRRQLTMVSCCLRATASEGPGIDPEEADLLLHEQITALTAIATRYGGHRTSTLADRALFVFGYPQTRENEARLAARAALEMVGAVAQTTPRLEVRLGVHTGLGLVREVGRGDGACEPLGACARMAAHLDELATAGDVLVSLDTQRLLRGAVGCEPTAHDDVFRLTPPDARAGGDTIRVARETPLVGRTPQLDTLLDGWAAAQRGRSGFALVTGEPGIGKSRLVRELRRRVPAASWMEARCIPESQDSPLRPIADVLATVADGALDALLLRHGLDPAETEPLLAELFGRPPDPRYPALAVSPDRRRDLTLQAITTLLLRIATERVLVLVVEDLHWADPTTLELLSQLLAALPPPGSSSVDALPRLYLVGTARPTPEGLGALSPTIAIPLARLEAADVIRLVGGAVGDARGLPSGILDAVVARADGIPLFVEEIARVLLEAEASADGAETVTVPGTLRDLFTARLDALSRGARETAQLAATLGREFRLELLRAIAATEDGVLREDLRELTDAGLVHQRTRQRPDGFVFKHALVRDAAYEMMPLTDRRRAHDGVARVLEELFPDIVLDRPEMLAHHCELAGRTVQAAEQWKRVGDRTMARGAYVESIRHLQRGVRLVEQAPARATLGALELGLIESLGTAQLSTQGYAAPEVEATFARAQAVCDRLGAEVPVRALHGIWGVHISRGNRAAVDEILPRFHRLAEHAPDPVNLLTAHAHTGLAAFLSGDFPAARHALEQAVPWYDSDAYRAFLAEYGYDGGLYAYAYLMWTLCIQGDALAARGVRDTMLALAQRSRNPYGLAIAYGFSANLAHGIGDVAGALDVSARAMAHANEQKLYLWLGPATCTHGWALVASGAREEGLTELAVGLGLFDMVGLRTTHPYHLALQAEAWLACDDGDEAGLAAVDTGLAMTAIYVDRFYEAEQRRLRGELLCRRGDVAGARHELESALQLAARQGAHAFALRAALGMGRLLAAQGEQLEARRLVSDACARLVPGGDTRDEAEAHARLAEWST